MTRKRTSEKELVVSTGAAAAAPRRKTTTRTRAKHPIAAEPETMSPAAEPEQVTVSYEDIALQAYLYWEARGCQGGTPEEDWLRAEEELKARTTSASAGA